MTNIGFRANPESVRYKEGATEARLGVRYAEIGAFGNATVVIDGILGFCPVGSTEGELNTDGACDEYIADGGVPSVQLGVRKLSNTNPLTHTFTYPEHYVIALAKAATLSVNYPGSPVNTTIDTGNGSIAVDSIPVATGAGATYAVNDQIEIVCGAAANGTRSLFRRIKSIASDVITLDQVLPAYFLPVNGAAVKKVESIDYVNNTAEFSDPFVYRIVEMDNVNQSPHIEFFGKVQATKGKYMPGDGKTPPKAELKLYPLGVYNSSTGYYDVSKRREIA
jgi:hypothetical protein